MIEEIIRSLVKTPELSMYDLENEVKDYCDNLLNDYELEKESGNNGPLTLYFGETGIQTIFPFEMMKNFTENLNTQLSTYWNHSGIIYNGKLVLPLWSLTPSIVSEVGTWGFYYNQNKVAEVVQNPPAEDEIYCIFVLKNSENWIERFNPNGDFAESISPLTGYVILETSVEKEIEAILLDLSLVGLHAFKPKHPTWSHSLNNGCSYIEGLRDTVTLNIPNDFSVERSKMFRFAAIGEDPFDSILRYWHIVEHMFDDLVEFIITELITRPSRPDKFSRNVSKNITEASCAKEIFKNRISGVAYSEIETFIDLNGLKILIEQAANVIGNNDYRFWEKQGDNRLKSLGSLLYSFRNAVAHRRETENWFDRLSKNHEQAAKDVIPLIQLLVYYAILNK